MELVYLWVEDYKNIHKQGFNFSPRFRCEYDEETKELTIDENDDYIENFFGDNINVTAIVGKNGSGKSNLLYSLIEANDVFFSYHPSVTHEFIMCYIEDTKKILVTNITLNNKTEFILEENKVSEIENHPFYLLHYDSSLRYFQRYWNNKTPIVTEGNFTPYKDKNTLFYYNYISLIPNKDVSFNELNKEETKNIIFYIMNPNKIIDSFFEPTTIFIESFDNSICNTCKSFEDLEVYSVKKYLILILEEALKEINEDLIKNSSLSNQKENVQIVGDFPLSEIINDLKLDNIDLKGIDDILSQKVIPINENFYLNFLSWEKKESIIFNIKKLQEYIHISLKVINKNELIIKTPNSFKVNNYPK